jgi:hypothetical protein
MASARARRPGRGGVSLYRHAGARIRRAARVYQQDRSRGGHHRPRRGRSC